MKIRHLILLLCMGHIGWAQAEIYKYIDRDGHVTYSSTPIKGGKKLNLEPLPTMEPFNKSGADFPRVNQETQRNRDGARRKILEDELANEEKQLTQAQQDLQTAQDNPETHRGPAGNILIDVPKQEEKLKLLQEQISLHERNIEALKAELSHIK